MPDTVSGSVTSNLRFVGAVFAAVVVVIFIILAVLAWIVRSGIPNEVGLPVLIVAGVVVLLATLGALSLSFAYFGLQHYTEALALPPGSIRAVLALMLVVLFAILVIYLYGSLSTPHILTFPNLTLEQKNDVVTRLRPGELVEIIPSTAAGGAPLQAGTAADTTAPAPAATTYSVYVRADRDAGSDDFAKQVLVLMGTLVASISSFYFATRVDSGAARSAGGSARVTLVSPGTIAADGFPHDVTLAGTLLSGMSKAELVNGATRFAADKVQASENAVVATFKIPFDAARGSWDVVLSDATRTIKAPTEIILT